MKADEIRTIVNEIRNDNRDEVTKEQFYKKKYPTFVNDLPKLFAAAINNNFPLQYLDLMLTQYDEITKKKTTIEDADVLVYGKLRGDYVDPLIADAKDKGLQPEVTITEEKQENGESVLSKQTVPLDDIQ